jgi:alkanesulfonate monooxygenase SsuD/methylene tetrahydromethanopterin reductase-like flavin-dependent oxidoreductase (luciferase family)
VATYRREFRPSAQLDRPYVIAGLNVVAADTTVEAQAQFVATKRSRATVFLGQGRTFSDEEADMALRSPAGQHVQHMLTFSAVGAPTEVREYVEAFAKHADADELIVAHQASTTEAMLRSVELLADSMELTSASPK